MKRRIAARPSLRLAGIVAVSMPFVVAMAPWFRHGDASGRIRAVLRGHAGPVTALAFSPDGRTLASGAWDGKVVAWDTETLQPRHTLTFGPGTSPGSGVWADVWPLRFTADGTRLVAANLDNPMSRVLQGIPAPPPPVLKVWELSDGEREATLALPGRARELTLVEGDRPLSMIADHAGGRRILRGDLTPGAFDEGRPFGDADGRLVTASADGRTVAMVGEDGDIAILDSGSTALRTTIRQPSQMDPPHPSFAVLSAQLSHDGRTLGLFVRGPVNTLLTYDTASGSPQAVITSSEVWSHPPVLAFSPDGRWIAIAGGTMQTTGVGPFLSTSVRRLTKGQPPPPIRTRVGLVRIYEAATGRPAAEFSPPQSGITEIVYSPDGKTLATADRDWSGTVVLLDTSTVR